MKILAIMQNMYVHNPAKMKQMLATSKHPEPWNFWIKYCLFAGCVSGKRIEAAYGNLIEEMIFDETTTEIADNPKTIFEPDYTHIYNTLNRIKPGIVIAFGKIAKDALNVVYKSEEFKDCFFPSYTFFSPHPAARGGAQKAVFDVVASNVIAQAIILRGFECSK